MRSLVSNVGLSQPWGTALHLVEDILLGIAPRRDGGRQIPCCTD